MLKEGALPTIFGSECPSPKRRKCDDEIKIVQSVELPHIRTSQMSLCEQNALLMLELNELRQKAEEANELRKKLIESDIKNQKLVVENNKLKTKITVQSKLIAELKSEIRKISSERDKLEAVFKKLVSDDYLPSQAMGLLEVCT